MVVEYLACIHIMYILYDSTHNRNYFNFMNISRQTNWETTGRLPDMYLKQTVRLGERPGRLKRGDCCTLLDI